MCSSGCRPASCGYSSLTSMVVVPVASPLYAVPQLVPSCSCVMLCASKGWINDRETRSLYVCFWMRCDIQNLFTMQTAQSLSKACYCTNTMLYCRIPFKELDIAACLVQHTTCAALVSAKDNTFNTALHAGKQQLQKRPLQAGH